MLGGLWLSRVSPSWATKYIIILVLSMHRVLSYVVRRGCLRSHPFFFLFSFSLSLFSMPLCIFHIVVKMVSWKFDDKQHICPVHICKHLSAHSLRQTLKTFLYLLLLLRENAIVFIYVISFACKPFSIFNEFDSLLKKIKALEFCMWKPDISSRKKDWDFFFSCKILMVVLAILGSFSSI